MSKTQAQLWPAARPLFITALGLFVITIVIGILNGIDVYTPDHDTLITHVHAGTLGWITLAVTGAALLLFSEGSRLSESEVGSARTMAWSMAGAIGLYVAAFWIGDAIPGDRIQRPIAGALVLAVVVWVLTWLWRRRVGRPSSIPRLALLLAWVSLLMGAVFGIILGIFTARGEVPGLSDEVATGLAEAHPAAMVIGFLILAGMAIAEWLLSPESHAGRRHTWGLVQVWIVFLAGILVNVAFIADAEDLLGPANLMEIIGVVIFVARLWPEVRPVAWKIDTHAFARLAVVFLVADLVVLTVLVQQILSGSFNIDDPTAANLGLVFTLDHLLFIGVMTNLLFGLVATSLMGETSTGSVKLVLWGTNLGLVGFSIGLIAVSAPLKRISTPVMGLALLLGIYTFITGLVRTTPEREMFDV